MAAPTAVGGATMNTVAAAVADLPAANKNSPHLHSVATSLRSCLDGMLPDNLRNDATAFQHHLEQQKARIQTEKNSWRFGLNYLFETLKQHKDWYARNQQYVQLKKDVKRFETHVSTIRSILSESVSKLDLEAGLRGAELEGRVGAYKVLFEVTKIVSKLSRPLVKLQILKPNDSSLSIYCDTFVLDIVLADGEGAVESASLTTVEKDLSKQFPERDEDLLRSLRQLAAGDSFNFTEKLIRLVNRAELAVKFPSLNFEQLDEELYAKAVEACSLQSYWTVTRAVEGITIHFKDPLHCAPVIEPPRKKIKLEDPQSSASADAGVTTGGDKSRASDHVGEKCNVVTDASYPKDVEASNPLADGEWTGSVSFIEWRGEVALHVVGYTPLVMTGVQVQRLALAAMRQPTTHDNAAEKSPQEDEKNFNMFVTWTLPDGSKPISPQLHFARDQSVCSVFPPKSNLAMLQEFSLTTKEISGGLRLCSFPIPLSNASVETLASALQICGHSLFFHSVLLSAFCSKLNVFGQRIPADNDDATNVQIKVDVASPERITLNTGEVLGEGKQVLIEISPKADCSLDMSVKAVTPALEGTEAQQLHLENPETVQKLAGACHSIPLLTYYALKRSLQSKGGQRPSTVDGEDCNGIAALDDDLSVSMKIEGEDMLLDDMGLF